MLWRYVRKIGNVDEGIVERGEDTSNTEHELAYRTFVLAGITILKHDKTTTTYHLRREGRERRSPEREQLSWS